jgi:hypothetical protein
MSDGNHFGHGRLGGFVALLSGVVALMTLGALGLLYMADVGADVILAAVAALTPGAGP